MPDVRREDLDRSLNRAAFVLAAAVLAVKPLYVFDSRRITPSLVMALLSAVAVLLWLTGQVRSGRLRVRHRRVVLPLAALAAVSVAAVFTAQYRRPATALGCEWVSTVLAVFCIVQTAHRAARARALIAMLLATAVVVALYGVYQYFVGLPDLRADYEREPGRVLGQLGIEAGTWMQKRFEKRLANKEAFSTFALSNTLAGYCLVLLPVVLGLAADALTARPRRRWAVAVFGGLAVVLLAALALTGSKGGYAVTAVVLGLFGVGVLWPRVRRHGRVLVPAVVVLLLLGAAAVAMRVRSRGVEGALGPSMRFRVDYWTGAIRVIGHRPFTGVGLGGFGDFYPRYKRPASPEDVRNPHNLVLGLWVDMGIPGVLAFGALLVLCLRPGGVGTAAPDAIETAADGGRAATRRRRLPGGPGRPMVTADGRNEFVLPLIAGAPLWLVVFALGLQSDTFCAAGALTWLVVAVALSSGHPPVVIGRVTRVGIVVGALGFVLHGMIDLDVSVPAMPATVLGLVAVRVGLRHREREPRGRPRGAALAALVVGGAGALWFTYAVARPGLAAEADFLGARFAQARSARLVRTDPPAAANHLRQALSLYERSIARDPLNADAHAALAALAIQQWEAGRSSPVRQAEAEKALQRGLTHLREAQRRHPRRPQFYYEEARVLRAAAEFAPTDAERRNRLEQARRAADRLVDDLYPSKVPYRLLRARLLEALGDPAAAMADYRAALDYDALQRDALLRLSPEDRAEVAEAVRRLSE